MNNTQLKRMISICKIVIALHIAVFVLLVFNLYALPHIFKFDKHEFVPLWDVIKEFFISISFFPKWLSLITLMMLLSIRIVDFIVVFNKVSTSEKIYLENKKKNNYIHILGLLTTPVWFVMLNFYGFNFGNGGEFYVYHLLDESTQECISYPLIYVFLIPAIIICVLLVVLDLSILIKPIKEGYTAFIMFLIFALGFMPAVFDVLIYGPNIKENLIKHNEKTITSIICYSPQDETPVGYVRHNNELLCVTIGEVNVEKTAETVKFDWREVSFEYTFKDEKAQEEYMIKVKGERLWFGKYRWRIIRSGLD